MKFRSDDDGYITALRFYKQPNNTGTHVGHLWSSTGQQLAEVHVHERDGLGLAGGDAADAGGDRQGHHLHHVLPLEPRPVRLQPRLLLRAASTDAPLHAPADCLAGGNGVYKYGASAFPDSTFNATNYWVDAVFEQTPARGHAARR